MGWQCPECNKYEPQVATFDVNMNPPRRAEDVAVIKLACGHSVGLEEAAAFTDKLRKLSAEYFSKHADLDAQRSKDVTTLWEAFRAKKVA